MSSMIVHEPVTIVCPPFLVWLRIVVLAVYVVLGGGVVSTPSDFKTNWLLGVTSGRHFLSQNSAGLLDRGR